MGASCFRAKDQGDDSPQKKSAKDGVPLSGAGKNRVNETDQAILDVKARQRKIKTYMQKMETQEK